jgi:hypothetical protein
MSYAQRGKRNQEAPQAEQAKRAKEEASGSCESLEKVSDLREEHPQKEIQEAEQVTQCQKEILSPVAPKMSTPTIAPSTFIGQTQPSKHLSRQEQRELSKLRWISSRSTRV